MSIALGAITCFRLERGLKVHGFRRRVEVLSVCQVTPYARSSAKQPDRENDEHKYALQFGGAGDCPVSPVFVCKEVGRKIDNAMPRTVNNLNIEP